MPADVRDAMHRVRRRLGGWLDHLAPRGCAMCGEPLAPRAFPAWCAGCLAAMPGARTPRCGRCAAPLGPGPFGPGRRCAACRASSALDATLAAADYAPPLDRVVTALKFGRQLALARPLGELVAARLLGHPRPLGLDCLVPVPLGAARLARRGFNQSLEIARAAAASLPSPVPVHASGLARVRETPAQADLGLAERRLNLRGCFACGGGVAGLTVGLVDDVMTSGSTLEEAARALKAAGAARVVALVAARTP